MSDLVKELRDLSSGPSWEMQRIGNAAADRIAQLEAALRVFTCDCTISERCAVPDNCRNFQARRTLETY